MGKRPGCKIEDLEQSVSDERPYLTRESLNLNKGDTQNESDHSTLGIICEE